MPELPEVETCVRYLSSALTGDTILQQTSFRSDLRFPIHPSLQNSNQSLTIQSIIRQHKYIVFKTNIPDLDFSIHLGMSGVLRLVPSDTITLKKHDHYQINFQSNRSLILNDPRRFGSVLYVNQLNHNPAPCALNKLTSQLLSSICNQSKQPIKTLLLDQKKISGLGNIYACEALFLSKISPYQLANTLKPLQLRSLSFAIKLVLKKAIRYGGTSIRDFKSPDQSLGYFQHHLWVYNQENKPCRRHGCVGQITRQAQTGRSSFFCATCQK